MAVNAYRDDGYDDDDDVDDDDNDDDDEEWPSTRIKVLMMIE